MQNVSVKVEEISGTSRKLKISVMAEEVGRALDMASEEVRRKANIKGYRKGKAPLTVVKRMYGGEIESEALHQLLNESYAHAVDQCEDLRIVSRPTIQQVNFTAGSPFDYEAVVEILPPVQVSKYKGLTAEVLTDDITDEQVTSHIEQIRESQARLVPVEPMRPSQNGDFLILNSRATIDGQAFNGGTMDGLSVELGSGRGLPGFDEQLMGMSPEENRSFDLTLDAERYKDSEFAGKTVHFDVTLKEIKNKILPELNDEFAKDLGEFSSMADFRKHVGEDLRTASKERFEREAHGKLVDALIEANGFDVPESLVAQEVEHMLDQARQEFAMRGSRLSEDEPFLDKLREDFRAQAKKRVQAGFLLDAVAKKEGITVGAEDVERSLQSMASRMQKPVEEVKRFYAEGNSLESLKLKIVEEKTLEFLMENAKISKKMVDLDDVGGRR